MQDGTQLLPGSLSGRKFQDLGSVKFHQWRYLGCFGCCEGCWMWFLVAGDDRWESCICIYKSWHLLIFLGDITNPSGSFGCRKKYENAGTRARLQKKFTFAEIIVTPPQNKHGTWKWTLGKRRFQFSKPIISRFHVEIWGVYLQHSLLLNHCWFRTIWGRPLGHCSQPLLVPKNSRKPGLLWASRCDGW